MFVNGDTLFEPDETFFVNLSNPTNAAIARAQGVGTIVNDDMAAERVYSQLCQAPKLFGPPPRQSQSQRGPHTPAFHLD